MTSSEINTPFTTQGQSVEPPETLVKRLRGRHLSLSDIAHLLERPNPNSRTARKYVQELIERMEARDGETYLQRQGSGTSKFVISRKTFERLLGDSGPRTLQARVRELEEREVRRNRDLRIANAEIRRLKKRNRKLEEFCELVGARLGVPTDFDGT